MSIQTELQDLATYLTNAYAKCSDKGATIPQDKNMYNLADCIDSITGGGTIIPPEAGNCLSIAIGSLPYKMSYVEGEDLDLTGLVVNGNFSSGMVIDVTNSCTITASDPVDYYYPLISISYEQGGNTFTTSFNITVTGIPVPAPASTLRLCHLNQNTIDEVSNTALGGSLTYVSGRFDYGCKEDGTRKTITTLNITTTDLVTGSYTIEFWGKNLNNSYNFPPNPYITNGASLFRPVNITQYGISLSNSYMQSAREVSVYHPTSWVKDEWRHYAVVFQNGSYKIFVNGKLWTTGELQSSLSSQYDIDRFGTDSGNVCYFDEVMVCAEAKYLTDFTPPHAPYYIPSSTPTDVSLDYVNETGQTIKVGLVGVDPDDDIMFSDIGNGESFSITVPYGQAISNTYMSYDVYDSNDDHLTVVGIDLTLVPTQDEVISITLPT